MSVWLVAILAGVPIGALVGGFMADVTSTRTVVLAYGAIVLIRTATLARQTGAMTIIDQ